MRKLLSLLALTPLLLGLILWPAGTGAASRAVAGPPARQVPEDTLIARVYYDSVEDLRRLSAYDLLEYNNPEEKYVLAIVSRADLTRLAALGFGVRVDVGRTASRTAPRAVDPGQAGAGTTGSIPGFSCYRMVEETYADAAALAAARPDLASWIDVGDSWEKRVGRADGYDLMVLVLANRATGGPKPKLFVTASIHAREYAPAELVIRFGEYLLDRYGTDADATWLLDHHEIHLMPQGNPDGRKEAEAGVLWRKNTNEAYCGATSSHRGADLNRNFDFQWGGWGGSSGDPCAETYRGPTPASEPETRAIQDYLRTIFPDQREDDLSAAAPQDAGGIYIDVHSFASLVLWPWGFGSALPPNAAGLQTLGRKFAYFNRYTPQQSVALYPTDGSTADFAYGELGVASYTFELGTDFFQDCATFESTVYPSNLDALIYAAKAARTPYLTPGGPEALDLVLSPARVAPGNPGALTATIDDTRFRQTNGVEPVQAIAAAEVYIDTPPWAAGAVSQAMAPADGSLDSPTEVVVASIDTAGLAPGRHILFVRGQDASGAWGAVSAVFLEVAVGDADFLLFVPHIQAEGPAGYRSAS